MTDGPGQQPPQEPRTNAADGEREVLEGRVIPSRPQSQRDADPRRQFRRQSPPPQAPEPGPAWSPQGDAAVQAAHQPQPQAGQPWSAAPEQPALDPTPQPEAATQIIPSPNSWSPQPAAPAPQAPQPQAPAPQPYAAPPQAPAPPPAAAPPAPQAPAQQQPQPYTAPQQPQPQAPAPQPQAPQAYAAPAQAPAPQPAAPARSAPAAARARGDEGDVPFAPFGTGRPPQARQSGGAGGFPQRGGGSGGAGSGTPDWNALAEQQEESGARRRRLLMLVGGIVAVAVIAGGVATAVVMSGKSDGKPAAGGSSTGSTASQQPLPPTPSFSSVAPPPPANPLDYLGTAAKDTAPLTPDSLFPGGQFVWQGRTYAKTGADVTTSCAKNARSAVATALAANGCQKLVRATYTQGALAVTVGVAVFADGTHAKKVAGVSQYLAPLNGGGVADFCHAVRCQMTANAVGRYAYFAIAGFRNGTTLAANDTVGKQAAGDASDYAFHRIVQRGKDAAAADPARQ